jgi:hypothetical protein
MLGFKCADYNQIIRRVVKQARAFGNIIGSDIPSMMKARDEIKELLAIDFSEIVGYKDWPKYQDGEVVWAAGDDEVSRWCPNKKGLICETKFGYYQVTNHSKPIRFAGIWGKSVSLLAGSETDYYATSDHQYKKRMLYRNVEINPVIESKNKTDFRVIGTHVIVYDQATGNFLLDNKPKKVLFNFKVDPEDRRFSWRWDVCKKGLLISYSTDGHNTFFLQQAGMPDEHRAGEYLLSKRREISKNNLNWQGHLDGYIDYDERNDCLLLNGKIIKFFDKKPDSWCSYPGGVIVQEDKEFKFYKADRDLG